MTVPPPGWITPHDWQQLEPVLDAMLDAPPGEREALLNRLVTSDPSLHGRVGAILRDTGGGTGQSLLDRSAGEVFSSLLRDDTEFVARAFAGVHGGRYTIRRRIGAGGMATVYLAHDARHDREVAIKIVHPDLAAILGSERFLAEIRTTARLQHPHLLPLLDSGEAGGQLFYVMPYVAGESLRSRLEQEGVLPVADAVRIAREVAGALDYAHRHGVIHRDIKPENLLLHEGQALVADWGIALAASAAGHQEGTAGEMARGTPHYMSPEQAAGDRPVDARADIHALGCVLYEMLTGEPPFPGRTVADVLAALQAGKPAPPSERRETVSPALDAVVLKTLARLPADRFATAAQFSAALAHPDIARDEPGSWWAARPRASWAARARILWLAAVATLLAVVSVGTALLWPRPPVPVTRMLMTLPAGQGLASGDAPRFAVSPRGDALAYTGPAPQGRQLWLKRRDQLTATPIAGTEGADQPVFSPDGRRVAFLVRGGSQATLKVAPLDGGPVLTLATSTNIGPSEMSSAGFRGNGLAWGEDGYLYLDGEGGRGPVRIRASGGPVERAESQDREAPLAWWPAPLPGSEWVLVTLALFNSTVSGYRVAAMHSRTGAYKVLGTGTFARYASSGHLLYVTPRGELLATPFDARRAEVTGPAVVVLDGLDISLTGGVDLTLSNDGTLVYVAGVGGQGSRPVWVRRDGTAEPVDAADAHWRALFAYGVALSPDGTRLAYSPLGDGDMRQVWVRQLPRGPLTRLTLDAPGVRPAWRDNRTLLFGSRRNPEGQLDIWSQPADGSAPPQLVVDIGESIQEFSAVPATPWIALRVTPRGGGSDLMAIRPGVDRAPRPLLITPHEERVPTLSPDGRFLAYVSNESGRQEVYVRPFPDVQGGRWQVSDGGGTGPLWSRSGRELFLVSGGELVAVAVALSPTFAILDRRTLFPVLDYEVSISRAYDEAPDGRFVMFRRGSRPAQELVVVENFFGVLRDEVSRAP